MEYSGLRSTLAVQFLLVAGSCTHAIAQSETLRLEPSTQAVTDATPSVTTVLPQSKPRSEQVEQLGVPARLTRVQGEETSGAPSSLKSSPNVEVVIQRFRSGKPNIQRQVTLDASGNYVNHGVFQQWNENGDLIMNGTYFAGQRKGPWIQYCTPGDSNLFQKEPYNKFKPPFQSTAEFVDGKMHGFWTITDKEGRTVSQIELDDGRRNGAAVWYHPSGVPLWQSEYRDGLLDGLFIEKDPNGKLLREIRYQRGRRLEKKQEFYSNKQLKSEYEQFSATQVLKSPDDWDQTVLASYELSGVAIQHGAHNVFFENGSQRSSAQYKNGQLNGLFESWYANGQKEVSGGYEEGAQHGKWNWWHSNGMRRAVVTYQNGKVEGEILAWSDAGQRLQASEINSPPPPQQPVVSATTVSVQTPKRPGTTQRTGGESIRRTANR